MVIKSATATADKLSIATALTIEPCAGGWALIDRSRVKEALSELFDPTHYGSASYALRDGRGQAFQVTGSFGVAALRHYRRGGMTGALWQDRYAFLGAEQTRCFRELRLLNVMFARGLPVPAPLGARFVRSGLSYRADILTAWLPGANPLSAHVQTARVTDFSAIGQMLARFHGACIFAKAIWHADLNAHNILLTDQGPALIDFDRCKLRAPKTAWRQANLARLLRSLTKLGFAARPDFTSQLMPALMRAYETEMAKTG
jgi:3-deoxy-D-manno-octulosonic acid kinase